MKDDLKAKEIYQKHYTKNLGNKKGNIQDNCIIPAMVEFASLKSKPSDDLIKAIEWCDDIILKCRVEINSGYQGEDLKILQSRYYAFEEMKQYLLSLQSQQPKTFKPLDTIDNLRDCLYEFNRYYHKYFKDGNLYLGFSGNLDMECIEDFIEDMKDQPFIKSSKLQDKEDEGLTKKLFELNKKQIYGSQSAVEPLYNVVDEKGAEEVLKKHLKIAKNPSQWPEKYKALKLYSPYIEAMQEYKYQSAPAVNVEEAAEAVDTFLNWAFKNYQWTGDTWDENTGHDDFESYTHKELFQEWQSLQQSSK